MFTVITAASAKMGCWNSKANHSHAVQLPEVLRPSGLIGSAGSGRHAAFPRGRLEMLQNYQLGLKACRLWSVQRRVGPTENVKPSPCYSVQSTELHPCDESRTVCARQLPFTAPRCSVFTASGAWSHQPYELCISWKVGKMLWRRPWHFGLPHSHLSFQEGGFWEEKTGGWRPIAYSCALLASHPGEQAPGLELTWQTWHREMPASPSRKPSWTSTGLLCSPVVQPSAQANKSSSSFPS